MGLFNKLLHAGEGKKLKLLESIVPDVNAFEPEMEARSDDELRALTAEFRARLDAEAGDDREARVDMLDELLPEAFATVREAAKRTIGQRHFDVQIMGGAALHFGWVSEMKTGEGKTLVATLPLYLNALAGYGVHLVTVNDYLVKRDASWMGQIYRFLGLEVGIVVPDIDDWDEKKAAYNADITYGTNNEFGFDYLRDNMSGSRAEQVQRGHSFAIVDEVDSILVDEARTPLIISGRADDAQQLYYQFARVVAGLSRFQSWQAVVRFGAPMIAGGDAAGFRALLRYAVRLDLVLGSFDELGGVLEIGDGSVELADRDVAMSPMPVHARIVRMLGDAFAEDTDRFTVVAQIAGPPTVPDDVVGVIGVRFVGRLGRFEIGAHLRAGLGRAKGFTEKRHRLHAVGDVGKNLRRARECGDGEESSEHGGDRCFHGLTLLDPRRFVNRAHDSPSPPHGPDRSPVGLLSFSTSTPKRRAFTLRFNSGDKSRTISATSGGISMR